MARRALNNDYYRFVTQEDHYQAVAGPLESMKGILLVVFFATTGSAVVVLALVLLAFTRDRRQEIGIYLALGEKKSRIIAQMLLETLLIGLLGAVLALAGGTILASYISDTWMTAAHTDAYEKMISQTAGYISGLNLEGILENYRVVFTPATAVLFLLAITATIIASQLASAVYILRYDPKKIMVPEEA